MAVKTLGKKQTSTHEDWIAQLRRIHEVVSEEEIERLIERTVRQIRERTSGSRVGFGWSGGKDSMALEYVMNRAGVQLCVYGMTTGLEYPEFLRWITDHMPHEVEVIANGWDLEWLAAHPTMLFPADAQIAAKWFKGVQHAAQTSFFRRWKLDYLALGRRRADGNYVGKDGGNVYRNRVGVVRYSPLSDWTHEEVLALIHYKKLDLAPCYFWPRGFRVGTGAWPARQWTDDVQHGWSEVHSIDPQIVKEAAQTLPSAREFLAGLP